MSRLGVTPLHLEARWLPVNSLGVGPLHFEAGGYLLILWEWLPFIWRPVVTCKVLGSGSPSFGGQRLSLSRFGVAPLHLDAGGYL